MGEPRRRGGGRRGCAARAFRRPSRVAGDRAACGRSRRDRTRAARGDLAPVGRDGPGPRRARRRLRGRPDRPAAARQRAGVPAARGAGVELPRLRRDRPARHVGCLPPARAGARSHRPRGRASGARGARAHRRRKRCTGRRRARGVRAGMGARCLPPARRAHRERPAPERVRVCAGRNRRSVRARAGARVSRRVGEHVPRCGGGANAPRAGARARWPADRDRAARRGPSRGDPVRRRRHGRERRAVDSSLCSDRRARRAPAARAARFRHLVVGAPARPQSPDAARRRVLPAAGAPDLRRRGAGPRDALRVPALAAGHARPGSRAATRVRDARGSLDRARRGVGRRGRDAATA